MAYEKTIILLSGPIGSGKTTLAARMVRNHAACHIKTSDILSASAGHVLGRSELRQVGLERRFQGGEWIADAVVRSVLDRPAVKVIVVDAVRTVEQVRTIRDYAKYALLRALCSGGDLKMRLGVIWYLTVHPEFNRDGQRRAHISREGWDGLDSELLDEMRAIEAGLRSQSDRHLSLIERSDILPDSTVFFSEPLPDAIGPPVERLRERTSWFTRTKEAVAGCELIFLDPDTGLEVRSVSSSSRLAGKYVTVAEVASLLSTGASVVFYQHCDRSPWRAQCARIRDRIGSGVGQQCLTIRSVRFGASGSRAFFVFRFSGILPSH